MDGYIPYQTISLDDGVANKIEEQIQWSHQVGKRLEGRHQCVTNFTQSQTA